MNTKPVQYVGMLLPADVDHPTPFARGTEIFNSWMRAGVALDEATADDPNEIGEEVELAAAYLDARRDYLIEFVDVHGLTYGVLDPRNATPGVADHFEIRDADGLVVGTSAEVPVELQAGHTLDPVDDEGRAMLAEANR